MSKYKVGDKVRVVKNQNGHNFVIGTICTITEISIHKDYDEYTIDDGNKTRYAHDYELELIPLEEQYENFSVKGSFAQLSAFKEAVEEIGWKYFESNNGFQKRDIPVYVGFLFRVITHDSEIVYMRESQQFGLFSTGSEKVFNLPVDFSIAYEYAKKALESIKPKFPLYRKLARYPSGNPAWIVGQCYEFISKDSDNDCNYRYNTYNRTNEFVQWSKDLNEFDIITKEEYDAYVESQKKVTCNFGKILFTIEKERATCSFGTITKKEVELAIDRIQSFQCLSFFGHKIKFDEDRIEFGCQRGTLAEAKQLLNLLKQSK